MKVATIFALAIAAAVMLVAAVASPKTSATPTICHSVKPTIVAPATAVHGTKVKITGTEGQAPAHTVTVTLQSRISTAKTWVNGAVKSLSLSTGKYSVTWKAPAKKGTYKLRVRLAHAGTFSTSAVKTVKVN